MAENKSMTKLTFQDWARVAIIPGPDQLKTQLAVFDEEHQEYWDAKDNLERMDAICDQEQVLACIRQSDPSFDLTAQINDFMACEDDYLNNKGSASMLARYRQAVIESNFSKFCDTEKKAMNSMIDYADIGIHSISIKRGNWFVIYCNETRAIDGKVYPEGKILKGVDFKHPEFYLPKYR